MRQIGVIGLGKFGTTLAHELTQRGAQVLALDRKGETVEAIKDEVTHAAQLDATDPDALKAVGIQNMDAVVVCIGEEIEDNLLTAILLKKLGLRRIWVRSHGPLQTEILKAIEVDEIINLEEEMGRIVAAGLVSVNVVRHVPLGKNHSLAEIEVPKHLIGKSLREIDPRGKFHLNVVALRRKVPNINDLGEREMEDSIEVVPDPDLPMEEGFRLVVVGTNADIERFSKQ